MVSISFGSITSREVRSMPSIRISGADSLPSFSVPMPRILNVAPSLPGSPPRCTAVRPAILPASALVTLAVGERRISLEPMLLMAPVTVSFRWTPKPTTTTSSIESRFSFSQTVTSAWLPTGISWGRYPIRLICRVSREEASIENFPCPSAIVPRFVPFTTMVAPTAGACLSSRTVPLTASWRFCWAAAVTNIPIRNMPDRMRRRIFLLHVQSSVLFIG